jgi:transposase
VAQINDLSRSLTAFDPISTLVVIVEMSKASWPVSGVVPGIERQPLKKLEPDATALLRYAVGMKECLRRRSNKRKE